jgi:hypothetical protein
MTAPNNGRRGLMVTTGVLCIAGALAAAAPAAQKPVSIVLPSQNVNFRPAPGIEIARKDCLSCHSAEYVLLQPVLSKAGWTNEVTKMRVAYGAPIPDEDTDGIVAYLVAQNPVPAK